MTSQAYFVRPPRIASWLVNLFSPAEAAESILGDLSEEYSLLASKSGPAVARIWYWRQAVKTIAHLAGGGFRIAPWSTSTAIVGGFVLLHFCLGWSERAIFTVLHRYRVFDHHFAVYVFFASYGIEIGRLILSVIVGSMVGLVAKGREMVAATTLGIVLCAMAGSAVLVWVARGQDFLLWTLPWQFAGWVAIIIGGAIVRTIRSAAKTLPWGG
jgi:hypothetical protein